MSIAARDHATMEEEDYLQNTPEQLNLMVLRAQCAEVRIGEHNSVPWPWALFPAYSTTYRRRNERQGAPLNLARSVCGQAEEAPSGEYEEELLLINASLKAELQESEDSAHSLRLQLRRLHASRDQQLEAIDQEVGRCSPAHACPAQDTGVPRT
jgi:hypothetical protein